MKIRIIRIDYFLLFDKTVSEFERIGDCSIDVRCIQFLSFF